MSDRPIKLMLIDPDPIFRTGLRVVLEKFSHLKVVAEAENDLAALEILGDLFAIPAAPGLIPSPIDVVILELSNATDLQILGWQLKTQYPNLPILLFSSWQESSQLAAAKVAGVEGYCPKGISVAKLVTAIEQVAAGKLYWFGATAGMQAYGIKAVGDHLTRLPSLSIFPMLQQRWRLSGLKQIDTTLAAVRLRLQPGIPLLKQAFLTGQQRELLAARWLVDHLLPPAPEFRARVNAPVQQPVESAVELSPNSVAIAQPETSSQIQLALFKAIIAKLQFSLDNLTSIPLEIDIIREEKKRELLYLVLRKIENILNQLRSSQVQLNQLPELRLVILRDLWQGVTGDFLGRYSTLQIEDRNLEVVELLQDASIVQAEILDKIPLVDDFFAYLLFQEPLIVDNVSYPSVPKALECAELVLNNLLIQVANAVVQPLLNHLADVETIKQNFYDRRLISTREIERFRNNLSWKYRFNNYINEPQAIFESRYNLLIFTSRGIAETSVYAPRTQELKQLSGIALIITLILEFRDAIAPRLRALVAFLGSGIVYVLTQVIGKAIGLIGRGILQGLGSSFSETRKKL